MGSVFPMTASPAVVALSARAIVGAVIAILLLLIIANLVKKDTGLKKLIYIVLVSVVAIASTVLLITSLNATQDNSIFFESLGFVL